MGGRVTSGGTGRARSKQAANPRSWEAVVHRLKRRGPGARADGSSCSSRSHLNLHWPATHGGDVTNATPITEITCVEVPHAVPQSIDAQSVRERELMERILQGETEMFYELVKPYERAV